MNAKRVFRSKYFDFYLCPTWHPGWQTYSEHFVPNMRLGIMIIPGTMFVIKWRWKV